MESVPGGLAPEADPVRIHLLVPSILVKQKHSQSSFCGAFLHLVPGLLPNYSTFSADVFVRIPSCRTEILCRTREAFRPIDLLNSIEHQVQGWVDLVGVPIRRPEIEHNWSNWSSVEAEIIRCRRKKAGLVKAFSVKMICLDVVAQNNEEIERRIRARFAQVDGEEILLLRNFQFFIECRKHERIQIRVVESKPSAGDMSAFCVGPATQVQIQISDEYPGLLRKLEKKSIVRLDLCKATSCLGVYFKALKDLIRSEFKLRSHVVGSSTDEEHWGGGGVLLHGVSGCGKNFLVQAVVEDLDAQIFTLQASDLVHHSNESGGIESFIRNLFRDAAQAAVSGQLVLLFLDSVDVFAPNREGNDHLGHEIAESGRVLATLLTLLDGVKQIAQNLFIIGATQNPNRMDPAMRRPGRFDTEIEIVAPDKSWRKAIFHYHILRALSLRLKDGPTCHLSIGESLLEHLGTRSFGFVGADIEHLCTIALRDISTDYPQSFDKLFEHAFEVFIPSSRKGHEIELSRVSWDDIGGLDSLKSKLRLLMERSEGLSRLGIPPPKGILLFGPPGCSKTTIVKAIASSLSSACAFLAIDSASLYSSYVGEAELNIRRLFSRARANAPCVIFLDEIEAIVSKRGDSSAGGSSQVQDRVLSTLLNEMDGIVSDSRHSARILVIAATNFPENLDSALIRPGRFDHLFYVPAPDLSGIHRILEIHTSRMPLSSCIDLHRLACKLDASFDRYSGADVESICREAAMRAMRRNFSQELVHADNNAESSVCSMEDFEAAIKVVPPSISSATIHRFDSFNATFGL